MKKALVVGIDYYNNGVQLSGCVNDSKKVRDLLEKNQDGTRNFAVKHISVSDSAKIITRKQLKTMVEELFKNDNKIALFYFSGHGYIESTGGYLITSECEEGDSGLPLNEILSLANDSPALSKIIIIDACHSGAMGSPSTTTNIANIAEGVTILTASTADQSAYEENGSGVFTSLLVHALSGGARNILGEITPGSIYAYIDQSLGPWKQRPIFKTNVKNFTKLRTVNAPIPLADLQKITELFPTRDYKFQLDPSYEPERSGKEEKKMLSPQKEHTEQFAILQKMNRVNLVVPVDAPHMWHAAMYSKSCKLTILGEHYWNLVKTEMI